MENNEEQGALEATKRVTVDIQQAFDLSKADMNLLAAICTPGSFLFRFPPTFLSIWQWLTRYVDEPRSFRKLAVGLPRGFAKTSVLKLFIVYCIFFSKRQYILIVGASEDKAIKVLTAVADILDNPQVKQIYGDWRQALEIDTKAEKSFWIRGRRIYLHAVGAGTSIRGANVYDNMRPDMILFDDIQDREDSDSQQIWEKFSDWFQSTALKTCSPFGCMYVFLGNMYPTKYSMLKWLCKNPDWLKYVTGAILADGTSLWPELFPIQQLLDTYKSDCLAGKKESFLAELMNDPDASTLNKVDYSLLPECPFSDLALHTGSFIMIDPSGGKTGGDDVSIGYITVHDGVGVLTELIAGKLSPGDTIKETLKLCLKHNCTLVIGEGNGYQETLLYWFGIITEAQGIMGITFLPEHSGMQSKAARIAGALAAWLKGEVYVSPACWDVVMNQVKEWNPVRRNNTDGLLDLLVYTIRISAKYADFFANQTYEAVNNSANIRVVAPEENSPF